MPTSSNQPEKQSKASAANGAIGAHVELMTEKGLPEKPLATDPELSARLQGAIKRLVSASTEASLDEARSLANLLLQIDESLNQGMIASGSVPSVAQLLKTLQQESQLQVSGIRGTFVVEGGKFCTGIAQSHGRYLPVIGAKVISTINGH